MFESIDLLSLSQISQIVTATALVLGVLQLRKEYIGQNNNSLVYLHNYLSKDQFIEARHEIKVNLRFKDYDEWTDEDRSMANLICSSYDQAGILLAFGIVNAKTKRKLLASSWGVSICDQYECLAHYLEAKQTPSQNGKEFFKHFVALYNEAKKYQN
jgi:hypothetical protein